MGEYDFKDNLVAVARFQSPTEAAEALALLESAGIEASVEDESASSASLLVLQRDYQHAKELLSTREPDDEYGEYEGYDDDWLDEDWTDDEDTYDEPYSEEPTLTPPIVRAWRAALIGGLLMPILLLNIYSMGLIIYHRLWQPQLGESTANWRFYAALFFNLIGVLFFWLILRW